MVFGFTDPEISREDLGSPWVNEYVAEVFPDVMSSIDDALRTDIESQLRITGCDLEGRGATPPTPYERRLFIESNTIGRYYTCVVHSEYGLFIDEEQDEAVLLLEEAARADPILMSNLASVRRSGVERQRSEVYDAAQLLRQIHFNALFFQEIIEDN